MKFRATIEAADREHEVEFDIADDATAQARLSEALAKIQQRFLKKAERAPVRTGDTPRTPIQPPAHGGGTK